MAGAAVSMLAMGCGAAAETGALDPDAVPVEGDEAGDGADQGEAGGASAEQRGVADEPGVVVEGLPVAAPIKCGGHSPLCPQGMQCMPIRRIDGEIGYGHCE
ncbi:MAG: hypothetical protein WKG00_26195 [Polyangiaceae bacterium]